MQVRYQLRQRPVTVDDTTRRIDGRASVRTVAPRTRVSSGQADGAKSEVSPVDRRPAAQLPASLEHRAMPAPESKESFCQEQIHNDRKVDHNATTLNALTPLVSS